MSVCGGDGDALRFHERSLNEATVPESDEIFKLQMQLTWADGHIDDLKKKWTREHERADKAEKRIAELEAEKNSEAPAESSELRQKMEQIIDEKDAAIALLKDSTMDARLAKQETHRLREELQRPQSSNKQFMVDIHQARGALPGPEQSTVNQLLNTITARDSKIEQLVEKYDSLTSEHFNLLRQVNKDGDAFEACRAKKDAQEVELKELRERLTSAEASRDRYQRGHARLLNENKSHETTNASNNALITSLTSEYNQLETEAKPLQKSIVTLKFSIGLYIAYLDLAEAGFRVFDCRHNNLADVPNDCHSTREQTAGILATYMLRAWNHDAEFMVQYNAARGFVLDHHRAHENAQQGRAETGKSWQLKQELNKIDEWRRLNITYK